MKIKLLLYLIVGAVVIAGVQCKAPRNNPLDPLNPEYNFGAISGVVQSIGIPSVGISKVKVLWQNANLITETDANGFFSLNSIPVKDGNIIFSKEGYKSDTLEVSWGDLKRFYTQVFFNKIPILDTVAIYTVVENQVSQNPNSKLYVKAWVADNDNDVETVYVYNKSLNLKKALSDLTFETSITEAELGGNIEGTIGLDFSILAKDRFDNEFMIGEDRITRVIRDQVTGLSPATDDTVTNPVTLNWNEFEPQYAFTYMVEIYRNDFPNQVLILRKEYISSDSTSYQIPITLSKGRYYWVIWIVDGFQNRSRSLPVNFQID